MLYNTRRAASAPCCTTWTYVDYLAAVGSLYVERMPSIETAAARRQLAQVVNRVRFAKVRFTLTRYGKACAAIVPIEDLERLRKPSTRRKTQKESSRT